MCEIPVQHGKDFAYFVIVRRWAVVPKVTVTYRASYRMYFLTYVLTCTFALPYARDPDSSVHCNYRDILTQKLLHIRWSVSPTINLVPKRFCVSDKTFPVTKAQKLLITNNWRLYYKLLTDLVRMWGVPQRPLSLRWVLDWNFPVNVMALYVRTTVFIYACRPVMTTTPTTTSLSVWNQHKHRNTNNFNTYLGPWANIDL